MRKRKYLILLCLILLAFLVVQAPSERRMTVFLTGYSYWDNTPPGSAIIGRPVIHEFAGGSGTWADPITLAVGWRIYFGRHFEDYEPGTRFYIPRLRKYAIVEDLCGGAWQRAETVVAQGEEEVAERHVQGGGALPDLEG